MEEQLLALISAMYDAAMDSSQWPSALQGLADFMQSQAATFWVLNGGGQPALTEFSFVNFDPVFINNYLDGMSAFDPTVSYLVNHPDAPVIHCSQYLTEREIDRSEYYDWHLRHSDTRYRLTGQICPAPDIQAGITLHRTKKTGRFQANDLSVFNLIYRHLERSLRIGYRLETLGAMQSTMAALLDRNHVSLALLDGRRHVIYFNRKMERLFRAGDGIALMKSSLVLQWHEANTRLARVLANAAEGAGDFIPVRRPSGERDYLLFATPIPDKQTTFSMHQARICVAVIDTGQDAQMPLERLKLAFGLTHAEGLLAALLGAGLDLKSAATRLHIEYGTARARLADIYEKTGTHRQAELVRLLWLMMTPTE